MLDAMNQINTPRAAPESSWLLKARGEKSQRNAPSLLWYAHSAHQLQGHWANHHHKNIISMPLTCDSTLYYSALLICLISLLWFSSGWERLHQYWAFWVIKPARMPPFCPGTCVQHQLNTPSISIHGCLQIHALMDITGLWGLPAFTFSVSFAVSFCDMLAQGWIWPLSGLSQGHVSGGFGSGPHRTLQRLMVCSSERLIQGTGRQEGKIFVVSLAFIVLSKFPNHLPKCIQACIWGRGKTQLLSQR